MYFPQVFFPPLNKKERHLFFITGIEDLQLLYHTFQNNKKKLKNNNANIYK